MFLKNRNISSKTKRSKVTDYAALSYPFFEHQVTFCNSNSSIFVSCVPHVSASVHCCFAVTCCERADLLALVVDVNCMFWYFPGT